MKLIDLLVQELPKRGGWAAGSACCCQSLIDTEIYFYDKMFEDGNVAMILSSSSFYPSNKERVHSRGYEYVSLQQYEAALKALEKFEWDGKGLPPVGTEVEVMSPRLGWTKAKVTAITDNWIIAQYEDGIEFAGAHRTVGYGGSWVSDYEGLFRRLKTDKEVERELQREEYEGPVTPSEKFEWDGEGLPPIGVDCEYAFIANYREQFSRGKVLAYGESNVFMQHWASKNEFIQPLEKIKFRSIKTNSDYQREATIADMQEVLKGSGYGLPDGAAKILLSAIAQGKVSKLEYSN